jgi:hypothetical protein
MHDVINIKSSRVDAHYTDFRSITEDALLFDAKTLNLELPDDPRDQLMQVWLEIKASPRFTYQKCRWDSSAILAVVLGEHPFLGGY